MRKEAYLSFEGGTNDTTAILMCDRNDNSVSQPCIATVILHCQVTYAYKIEKMVIRIWQHQLIEGRYWRPPNSLERDCGPSDAAGRLSALLLTMPKRFMVSSFIQRYGPVTLMAAPRCGTNQQQVNLVVQTSLNLPGASAPNRALCPHNGVIRAKPSRGEADRKRRLGLGFRVRVRVRV